MTLIAGNMKSFLPEPPHSDESARMPNPELLLLSENLLYQVKIEEPADSIKMALSQYSVDDLIEGLPNDNAKKTFWLNIYNAYYQIFAIEEKMKAPEIFSSKSIHFADASFSLDNVEHGILRRYRWKFSLGYLPQLFPKKIIKRLAVDKIDFRIHFALNCGAKSCPPIAFYNFEKLEEQLTIATNSFLLSDTLIDKDQKVVYVTKLMQWFKADFGGNTGIRKILKSTFEQSLSDYKIKYNDYDWSADLKNFSDEN